MTRYQVPWEETSINLTNISEQGGISSSILSVFFTDKFALSQSDARISVAYKISQWKSLTKRLMKCPPGLFIVIQTGLKQILEAIVSVQLHVW